MLFESAAKMSGRGIKHKYTSREKKNYFEKVKIHQLHQKAFSSLILILTATCFLSFLRL